ncbi:MAG: glycoside hydrolase family 3 protein [Enterobacterales bacterium]|nr:glycoside hydrolase family 3 protein [Enterobacterales bacterium]
MPVKKQSNIQLTDFERSVAQRMMLSFRYFCGKPIASDEPCKTSMTQLPIALAELIRDTDLGGVVLFSENLESYSQIIQLTSDLQQAASQSQAQKPLLIGIDQEGGRVVRLPLNLSTAFSGNMAIGATYPRKGTYYATQVGRILGKELKALGINLNFAPDVDVNNNPDNPVINVRSFGQDPKQVAEQGIAMLDAMQAENVIGTLKHFPGHGNTNVDSHTGLPLIDYDFNTSQQTDLVPFKQAIESSQPGMIMTAHIQYPGLDHSELVSSSGERLIKPATMSEKILKNLLRDELGFKGIVITDALNMASISRNFDAVFAASQSLLAGADIALMPYKIRTPNDIEGFKHFVKQVAAMIQRSLQGEQQHQQSLFRIEKLATRFSLAKKTNASIKQRVEGAQQILASKAHRDLQKQLAMDSITLIKNNSQQSIVSQLGKRLHVIFQDQQQQQLVQSILVDLMAVDKFQMVTSSLLGDTSTSELEVLINEADSLLVFYSAKRESAVVQGEVDEQTLTYQQAKKQEQARLDTIIQALKLAKQKAKSTLLLGMQSPYELSELLQYSDMILLAYDAAIFTKLSASESTHSYQAATTEYSGVTYEAIVKVMLGSLEARGQLPVDLPRQDGEQSTSGNCIQAE